MELVGEASSLKPGSRAWLGLILTHEPHWHTYWINPGDSGLPTRLNWQVPNGFKVGDPEWPAPTRIAYGDLFNFGYENAVLVPIPVDVPAAATESEATIAVDARWLICNDVCIPGKATLSLRVPIAKSEPIKNSEVAASFSKARAARPVTAASSGRVVESGDRISIELSGPNLPQGELDAFPSMQRLFMNSPFRISRTSDKITISGQRSEYFESAPEKLSLVVTQKSAVAGKPAAWQFDIPWASQKKPTR